jgi:hypothetical protein
MFPLHRSTLWFGLVVMHPWFVSSNNLLSISSPSSAYHKKCCKDRPIQLIFSWPLSSLGTHHAYTFRNFKWSCIMLYAKPWKYPSAVATMLLSSFQLESTLPPTAHLFLLQSQQGNLVRHHLRLTNIFERISRPSCEPLYMTNAFHHKQETFPFENLLHWVLLPTKKHKTEHFFSVVHSSSSLHFDFWNQPLKMCMRVCYPDLRHGAGLCCYLVTHLGNLLCPFRLFYFHLWHIYWLSLMLGIKVIQ